ncbi:hypothetical protein TB2_033965 [Malus domestica]
MIQMVHNGEAKCPRKSLSGIEEKIISEDENASSMRYDSFKSKTIAEVDVHFPVEHQRLSHPLKKVSIADKGNQAYEYDNFAPMVDKTVDANWPKSVHYDKFPTEGFPVHDTCKAPGGLTNHPVYYNGVVVKGQPLPVPAISSTDHMNMMKRMAELEEKLNALSSKPAVMPPDKEETLNAALNRVNTLEQELSSTKKALEDALVRQDELIAQLEKKKKKKKFNPFSW